MEYGLLDTLEFKDSGGTVKAWTGWSYEAQRDVVTAIANHFGTVGSPTPLSQYAYGYDDLGRREHVIRTGAAFSGGSGDHLDLWSYDDRNEIESSKRHATTQPASANGGTAVTALDRHYFYDPTLDTTRRQGQVGNRVTADNGFRPNPPDPNDPNDPNSGYPSEAIYTANNLNQYSKVAFEPNPKQTFVHDLDP